MEVPRYWRLKAQRYRLEGSICPDCGQKSFPPRAVCPECRGEKVETLVGYMSESTGLTRKEIRRVDISEVVISESRAGVEPA